MVKKLSALSQREKRHRVKNGDISLTPEMKKELHNLKRRKINLTDKDAPEIVNWQGAVKARFYRPIKMQITIRLDADIINWFKYHSQKYQALINKACREYMDHHSKGSGLNGTNLSSPSLSLRAPAKQSSTMLMLK